MGYRFSGGQQSDTGITALGPVPDRQNRMDMLCALKTIPKPDRRYVSCQNSLPPSFDPKLGSSAEINFVLKKETP
jgi:hypothetical protein